MASAKAVRQKYESIGFDLHESKQFIDYLKGFSTPARRCKGALRWIFLVLVGLGTGLVAVCIAYVLHNVNHFRLHLQDELFEQFAEYDYGLLVQFSAWLGMSLVLAAIAGYLVCFQEPLAAGSGIPEIKCVLNGIDLPNVLGKKTLICKALGIVCSVAAGLPCGKEGPMIHSGAIVAAQVKFACAGPFIGAFRIPTEARDFVSAGAAAGVAAAFGAPIGGVLFAVEEGASHMNPRIMVRTFVCAGVAALTVRTFMGPHFGVLGTEVPVEFGRFDQRRYTLLELPIFALMGVAGGLLGALFNSVNTRITLWRMRNVGPRGWRRFLEVMLLTLVIVSFNFFAPLMFGAPHKKVSEYEDWQRLFLDLGGEGINILFHSKEHIDTMMLLFFALVHYVQTTVTYGLGVPSGLFVPSLLAGASFGRIVGQFADNVPGNLTATSCGLYALIGSVAMLGGMARITISLAVILMETTGDSSWSVPMFLTVMVAKWVGDLFNKGIYDIHIDLKHIPVLEQRPETHTLNMTAEDIMVTKVVSVNSVSTVDELVRVLQDCRHAAFPVVDRQSGRFLGLIDRCTLSHVLHIGKETPGVFTTASRRNLSALASECIVPFSEMMRNRYPRYPSVDEINDKVAEDYAKVVNLMPYVNKGAYTVMRSATVMRCHVLFRSMGLRHLPVVEENQTVCGLISRKELVAAAQEEEERPHNLSSQEMKDLDSRRDFLSPHGTLHSEHSDEEAMRAVNSPKLLGARFSSPAKTRAKRSSRQDREANSPFSDVQADMEEANGHFAEGDSDQVSC